MFLSFVPSIFFVLPISALPCRGRKRTPVDRRIQAQLHFQTVILRRHLVLHPVNHISFEILYYNSLSELNHLKGRFRSFNEV